MLQKIREEKETVLLVAPNWPNQPWFPELREVLVAPPWLIWRHLLSQAMGTMHYTGVLYPRPEL